MKKILLITTGGTIASTKGENGLKPGLEIESFLKGLDLPEDNLHLSTLELMAKDSTDMSPEDWVQMAEVISEACHRGYEGVVLTHGTDTMSYTCAALTHLVGALPIPVILTGSQLPMDAENSDGPKNLRDAIIVSLMDISGVFLVFDGSVMDGASVRKVESVERHAFISVDGKEIGEVYEEQLELTTYGKQRVNEAGKKDDFYSLENYAKINMEYRPAIIKIVPGMDGDIIRFYADKGVVAIIIEAFGTGGIPEYIMPDLEYAVEKNIRIYVTTQCLKGGTHMEVYEVNTRVLELGKGSRTVKNKDELNCSEDINPAVGVIEAGNKTVEYIYTGLILGKI